MCYQFVRVFSCREMLGADENWPFLLASNVLPGLIQLVLLPWAPKSPRCLLIDQGDQIPCICALRQLRGNDDFSSEMTEMLAEQMAIQRVEAKAPWELFCDVEAKAPWELFCDSAMRWQLITIVVLSSAMQLCGNDPMYFYAPYIFQEAGIPDDKIQYGIIGTGTCELITSMICVRI
ncbi:Solute carrier family 2, facilitated glucose transporter member 11 [Varanus komodoensis]|nr:Solute carrier family 2, facilitated glucose transporter member 11 [Varanus komodoensis]